MFLVATCSIILHEGAHAIASVLMGDSPASIELTPIGAVMYLDNKLKMSRLKRMVVILAGPMITFSLCCAAVMLTGAEHIAVHIGRTFFIANLAILLINLLPVLPMDGGRLISELLTTFLSQRIVNRAMKLLSNLSGIGLICLNIYVCWRAATCNLSLALIGCSLLYGNAIALTTQSAAEMRSFLDRKIRFESKKCMKTVWYSISQITPICKVISMLPAGKMAMYIAIEEGSMAYAGYISESELIQQYMVSPGQTMHEAVMNAEIARKGHNSGTN